MKKISLIFIALLFFTVMANAQKGQKQFNAGLGFASNSIPVYVGLDYWIHQDISLGAEIGWRRERFDWDDKYHYNVYNFLINGNYHFNTLLNMPEKFDFYAGANIGFYYWSNNYDNDNDRTWKNDHSSGLGLGGQVGFRYFFNSKFGVGVELNGGNQVSNGKIDIQLSNVKIGVSIRF